MKNKQEIREEELVKGYTEVLGEITKIHALLLLRGADEQHVKAVENLGVQLKSKILEFGRKKIDAKKFHHDVNKIIVNAEKIFEKEKGIWSLLKPVLNKLIVLMSAVSKGLGMKLFESKATQEWNRSHVLTLFKTEHKEMLDHIERAEAFVEERKKAQPQQPLKSR